MNLHNFVSGAISVVNPLVAILVQVSSGSTTNAAGQRVPVYANGVYVYGQVQALTYNNIMQVSSLNIQGVQRAIYIKGRIDGLIRENKKGGDLITTPDGNVWLTTLVLEYWPDWCKVAVTLQDGG